MKARSATAALRGVALFLLLSLPVMPGAHAQSTAAVDVVWEATRADFGGQMMDIDRFDNVYSVGDNLLGGTVLTRKFSPTGCCYGSAASRPILRCRQTGSPPIPTAGPTSSATSGPVPPT